MGDVFGELSSEQSRHTAANVDHQAEFTAEPDEGGWPESSLGAASVRRDRGRQYLIMLPGVIGIRTCLGCLS